MGFEYLAYEYIGPEPPSVGSSWYNLLRISTYSRFTSNVCHLLLFTETAVLLNLNLGATFLWQALLAGIAFVIGIFVAGKIAEQVLRKISQAA
jgi:hypothetical protein